MNTYTHGWNDPRMGVGGIYVFSMLSSLAPMMCENTNNYRVPVRIDVDGTHIVYVGDMHTRTFHPDSIPDFIRVRLAMIKTSVGGETLTMKIDQNLTKLDLFRTRWGNLEDIGWQASDTMYVVVMSPKELCILKGIR